MKYTVLTLFPEITDAFFATSIMAKAIKRGIIEYRAVNIRDYAADRHKTCDDAPYGGGPGMLMLPEPLDLALKSVLKKSSRRDAETQREEKGRREDAREQRVIYLSPSGKPFDQEMARELAAEKEFAQRRGGAEDAGGRKGNKRRGKRAKSDIPIAVW
jgi:tRNA (guanine37-N1)-methyltransferase